MVETHPPESEKHQGAPLHPDQDRVNFKDVLAAAGAAAASVHVVFEGAELLPNPFEGAKNEKDEKEDDSAHDDREGEELENKDAPKDSPTLDYSAVGRVLSQENFEGEVHTGEIQERWVGLFEGIFKAKVGHYYYFDCKGDLLLEVELSGKLKRKRQNLSEKQKKWEELDAKKDKTKKAKLLQEIKEDEEELKQLTQEWHNENRKKIDLPEEEKVMPASYKELGYPFVATPVLAGVSEEDLAKDPSLIQVILGRLNESTSSGKTTHVYFKNDPRTIYEGIVEIAKAYDIPRSIVLGIGANESSYKKNAKSDAGAIGTFQFTKDGFEDAKAWIAAHPEYGAKVRVGEFGDYESSCYNRFASAELFCANYKRLTTQLQPGVEALEARLRKLDSGFPAGTLTEIATITAYNAGGSRVKGCMTRFAALSDEEIKRRIGFPPYGVDVWLALMAYAFGATLDGTSTKVGPDVFMYAQKVLAMGALIMNEENYLKIHQRSKQTRGGDPEEAPVEILEEEENPVVELEAEKKQKANVLSALRQAGAVLSGAFAFLLGSGVVAANVVAKPRPRTEVKRLTRRRFLQAFAAFTSLAVPAISTAEVAVEEVLDLTKKWEKNPEEGTSTEPVLPQEKFPEPVLDEARKELDQLYVTLQQKQKEGKNGWTPNEQDVITKYKMPYQRELLKDKFKKMLGEKFLKKFEDSIGKRQAERKHLYVEGAKIQDKYLDAEKKAGHLVPLSPDDPQAPYFAEQVGVLQGTGNNPEALFTRVEFVPLMGSLVELVNHQVDLFNQHPELYGIEDPNFPVLPHITAIKISGALRSMEQTADMIEAGQAARTTTGTTAHWLGQALDMGSLATPGAHVVRLKEALLEEKGGKELVPAGGKLPTTKVGNRSREVYFKMIGRALFALKGPLKKQLGITILPLYEPRQSNWHVVLEKDED